MSRVQVNIRRSCISQISKSVFGRNETSKENLLLYLKSQNYGKDITGQRDCSADKSTCCKTGGAELYPVNLNKSTRRKQIPQSCYMHT